MRDLRHLTWRAGVIAGLSLIVLLYFPWGWALHTGIAVPEHLGWGLPGLLFLLLALSHPGEFYSSRLLLVGGVLLALPALWMPEHADTWRALTRLAALWGGLILLCWSGGRTVTDKERHFLASVVIVIGLVCAASVLLRVLFPALFLRWLPLAGGGWATGGYLQPELMALLLGTALMTALYLWLFRARLMLLPTIAVLAFALALCLRLFPLACVAVSCLVMLMTVARHRRLRLMVGVAVMLGAGVLAGLLLTLFLHQQPVLAWPSEWAAWPPVFRASLALLMAHPLTGTGYGTFAGSLPEGMHLAGLLATWKTRMVPEHPGSEWLYWITEGGAVALAGLVLLLAWGGRLYAALWRQSSRAGGLGQGGSEGLGLLCCALPLLLATLLTVAPGYASPLHYLLLIVLLGAALSGLTTRRTCGAASGKGNLLRKLLFTVTAVAVLWFSLSGTRVAISLQDARQTSGRDVTSLEHARRMNPLYLPDDVGFAMAIHQLQQFSQTGDKTLLSGTEPFFRDYLSRHPDPNVYSTYITVLDKQDKADEAEKIYQEGQRRVPWDPRFTPDSPTKD
ncbi:UNVERIFIED_ORG: O-antigen polymerase [Rahnella aquatilis]